MLYRESRGRWYGSRRNLMALDSSRNARFPNGKTVPTGTWKCGARRAPNGADCTPSIIGPDGGGRVRVAGDSADFEARRESARGPLGGLRAKTGANGKR